MAQVTIYSGAGDGWVNLSHTSNDGTSWADMIAGSVSGLSNDDTSASQYLCSAGRGGDIPNDYGLLRGFLPFDTSEISGTVTAATLSVYVTARGAWAQSFNVYGSTQASNTELADADYTRIGSTAFSDAISIGDLTLNAYSDFALNASGIAAITAGGWSKFSLRISADYGGSGPSGSNWGYAVGNFSESASNKPKLVVTYTPTAQGGFLLNFI